MTQTVDIEGMLAAIVGEDRMSVAPAQRERLAHARSELSPILRQDLPLTVPDVVVWPSNAEEVAQVLRLAYRNDVAVTPRGVGTGNYGQAVAFECGILMDFSRMTKILEVGEGYLRAQASARSCQLER